MPKRKIQKEIQKRKNKRPDDLPRFIFGISRDKEFFSENLSALVSSGMSITTALESISIDVRTKVMKKIIVHIGTSVENGSPLWRALDEVGIFKEHIISLIRIGEETGRLSENLKVVALQEQKSRMFSSKIRSALMYPVFVLILAFIVAILISWFILPRLATVFSQLNVELPTVTRALIATGEFLQAYGVIVIPSLIILMGAVMFFTFFFSKTKHIGQKIIMKIPGIGRLVQEVEVARFGFLLGTLLEAGVPITRSFESLQKASSFKAYRELYAHLEKKVTEGYTIQDSLKKFEGARHYIPSPIQQMVSSAEQSGNLPETLQKIGILYETKTDDTAKNLTVLLEPVLLVIVWLGVVGVALAVILPIYSLIGGFNQPI